MSAHPHSLHTPVVRLTLVALALAPLLPAQDLPVGPARAVAEFEPMEGVMISYPSGLPYELITDLAHQDQLVTVVADAAEQALVEAEYQARGVNLANCSWLLTPTEDFYARDWGPWFAFDANGVMFIPDHIYEWPNSPGDDIVPTVWGQAQGIPTYDFAVTGAGGNYMTDGQGTAISTDYLWYVNPNLTHAEVLALGADYLGLDTWHVLDDPDGWFHIDCYAKYLSPDTLLVASLPAGDSRAAYLDEMAEHLGRQISAYGTPYEVVRIHGTHPYSNALILNERVFVPLSDPLWDDQAIAAWEAAMPGYAVSGYSHPGWIDWDALHCRTKELADRHMLALSHQPLLDGPPTVDGFPVQVAVVAHSGQPLVGGAPVLHWSADGGPWDSVAMTPAGGDAFEAHVPVQPVGTQVRYWIGAEDESGRAESHPAIGEAGAHRFEVTWLGRDVSALSAKTGGVVEFSLDAGPGNAGRPYFVLSSVTGTLPGTPLPGGLSLPINWDAFTELALPLANSPVFPGFSGNLDAHGKAVAAFDSLGPFDRQIVGAELQFAFLLRGPYDFVSNPASVVLLD